MPHLPAPGRMVCLAVFVGLAAALAPALAGELSQDEQAMLVLNSARKAYNEQNYPFAIERFREFLQRFGGHREATSARYGMALALLEGPARDFQNAANELGQVAGQAQFPDLPYAQHYLGVARRGMGYRFLAEAEAKPNEAPNFRNQARQQFDEAAKSFAAAAASFLARVKAPAAADAPPPPELDWAARSRCDQCEMMLRTDRFKEANELAEAFIADAAVGKTRYRPLALYHLGYAKFALRDYAAAGRALSQLAPFQQEFGIHARYLLARSHHMSEERPEAATQYRAVVAAYDEHKKAAQAALQNPAALRPDQREFLQALVSAPPPEHVLRALFYLSLIQAEDGRFAEALAGFNALLTQFPKLPFIPEVQLRVGFCQMQLRTWPEAVKNLQPLCEHPSLADQALWWFGRCQVGSADPANPQAYDQAVKAGIETMRRAAERANQFAQHDPAARVRRGDILLEMADTQQLAKMFREAAQTYEQVLNEKLNPDRAEEAMQRRVTALHLAGMYRESDDAAKKFEQQFPKGTLLPAVLFRMAENAFMAASAAAAEAGRASREELTKQFTEAIARYQRLLKQFPEFQHANLAKHGMAAAHYRLGQFPEAIAVLSSIPEMERTGDLAIVSYVLADCLIRTLPPEAEDALGAAKLMEQAERAAKLLEGFVAGNPKSPQAPDAILKLGYCQQRIGTMLVEPAERQKLLQAARQVYESFMQQYQQDPGIPSVAFERAKCIALMGDPGGAMNELGRFRGDPFRNHPVAPLAIVRLSSLMRSQNRAAEAEKLMQECRGQHEERLKQDPSRAEWVPLLRYEHALTLKESGKLPEARALFEGVAKEYGGRPEAANAQWRAAQCRREELVAALAAAKAAVAKPGAKPEEINNARSAIEGSYKGIAQAVEFLNAQSAELAKGAAGSEAHLRALYELAWCHRVLAEAEVEAARMKLQRAAVEKALAKLGKEAAPINPADLRAPEVPLAAVPVQPAEKLAQDAYGKLIAAGPETPLGIQARLELSELLCQRGNHDGALELLATNLEKNPSLELAERTRLRLAVVLLAKGDAKSAMGQLQAVAKNQATPFQGELRYLTGEAFILTKDWGKAVEQLLVFRDRGEFHNIPGISDRALLRLGHAFAQAGQWDQARASYEQLVGRFGGNSPWHDEGRFELAWALQTMKQFDPAVQHYGEVVRRTVSVHGAKAQLQIGLCRLEQKNFPEAARALLAVPFTYDYPELNGPALCQAAQAYMGLNQPAEAGKLWQRVVKEHPDTEWAKAAQQGLAALQPPQPPPKKQ